MGSNRTQAFSLALFLIGFTSLAAGFSLGGILLLAPIGVVAAGVSIALFLKCKPWEDRED